MIKIIRNASIIYVLLILINNPISAQNLKPVTIQVFLTDSIAPMEPVWAAFGYDEPNYTYMKDGKKLLSEIAKLGNAPVYIRAHHLLTSGDGTPALKWGSTNAYTEDANGNPVYNWTIIDSIFDTYVKNHLKPLVEMAFMPQALTTVPENYQPTWLPGQKQGQTVGKVWTGWRNPPKDYNKWAELIYRWVTHSINRYGKSEVETWYWELWNEPNGGYWKGTMEEYFKLYDYTAEAIKRALPDARVGGPHVTGPDGKAVFFNEFIKHCIYGKNYVNGLTGTPLDFIGFHAKGAPKFVNGHVRMDMGQQLRNIYNGFKIISAYPQIKNLPIIIGESDPDGCAACSFQTNPENGYRNGTMYSSYTAAIFARKYELADSLKVNFKRAVTWGFEYENQPWFYGFRDMATNGVDKPVFNVFRMFGMMNGNRVKVHSDQMYKLTTSIDSSIRGKSTDIGALAAATKKSAAIIIWNYHDDDTIGTSSNIKLTINQVPAKKVKLIQYRIDKTHSNAFEIWKKMGSPQNPTSTQVTELETAGHLQTIDPVKIVKTLNGVVNISVNLPRQAVSLIKIEW